MIKQDPKKYADDLKLEYEQIHTYLDVELF